MSSGRPIAPTVSHPPPDHGGPHVKKRYFVPLLGFALPSLVVGFGFVIPGSCIAGVNNLTVGFVSTVAGASVTYWLGIRAVVADLCPGRSPGTPDQRRPRT